MKIEPSIITWHKLIAGLPHWEKNSPELIQLTADIKERGIDQPLLVCKAEDGGYHLLDGRHRHMGAIAAELSEVPIIIREESEALDIAIHSLIDRRHYTKGALAYMTYPLVQAQSFPNGGHRKAQSIESTVVPVDTIAARLGFGRDLFFQAREIHKQFASDPEARAHFEPQILAGAMGLGAVIAGLAGKAATVNQRKRERDFDQLIFEGFDTVQHRLQEYWPALDDVRRREVRDWAVKTVLEWPEEVRGVVAMAIRSQAKAGRGE